MLSHLRRGPIRHLAAGVAFTAALTCAAFAQIDDDLLTPLRWRHIGPIGNRVSAVVGVPGQPHVYYVGAASGGIFKTEDGGAHWTPIFDGQPAASIGSLAVAPSDPNVVWAGTGETFIRSNVSIGNGIYKSTDAGKTWSHMGLEETGRIGRIVIDPRNPDVALAAAMGHCYGPQQQRGVFRTADGGKTWERTLFVDEDTGASDLIMDPNNPRILFAGMWPMQIWTWGRRSGGPGGGLWKSTDGGVTWAKLEGAGLPEPPLGKIGLTMSAENSQRVYALIETNSNRDFTDLEDHAGVLWASDDGGDSWRLVSGDHTLAQRPLYYTRALAAPDRHNEIYFLSTQMSVSLDGGRTYEHVSAGGDHHDMWIDPLNPERMIVGHDQGISISVNRGESWFRPQLPNAQMYHVWVDDQIPYFVYGNRQDGPSFRGPSNTLTGGAIPIGSWRTVGGCESGFAIPDPVDNDIVWSGCYEGILERTDMRTGHAQNVSVWPDNAEAWPAKDLKYRFQWTFPIAISPHNHNRVFAGSQFVHATTDGGHSWRAISPDLTGDDKSRQQATGGLTTDDAGPTIAPVVFAIAESPVQRGLIWAGTNDGKVHVTENDGQEWREVTANIPDLPPLGTVSNIEPSRYAAGKAYLTVDLHQVNDPNPYVYKTEDFGQTWVSISGDVPRSVFSYAHCVREDPVRPELLYLGTENGVYFSLDDGQSWHPLQNNLPHAPAHWLTVQERFSDLAVATYGRGFWILDDVTPLQQLTDEILDRPAHLFEPRPAYRFRYREGSASQREDPAEGENPEYGASIHYYLKEAPEGEVKLSILDASGELIRSLEVAGDDDSGDSEGEAVAGLRRVYWDLRHERSEAPKLRTKPDEHSHVEIGERGWRPLREGGRFAPLAAPGVYTVKLEVDGEVYERPLTVLKDPSSDGSEADIRQTLAVTLDLRDMLDEAVEAINEIELSRVQVETLRDLLGDREDLEETLAPLDAIEEELKAIENEFFDLRLTDARQDTLRWPRKLYSKMGILARTIDQSDFAPTTQQLEVYELYKGQLADHLDRLKQIKEGAVEDLNERLREENVPYLVAP